MIDVWFVFLVLVFGAAYTVQDWCQRSWRFLKVVHGFCRYFWRRL